ncbi:MAG TPA: (2Fe-2S) ferredoxin domain-containing protein, partial [Clostridia bacterium]|nr:(2Fe-2S) ferredoxin domain-containing protein [Clostridia bacterium]
MMMTLEKLNEIRQATFQTMNLRGLPSDRLTGPYKWSVVVCMGTGCTSSRSPQIRERLKALIDRDGLADQIEIVGSGCFGLCEAGPVVIVHPGGTFYSHLEVEDIDRIYQEHLVGGQPVLDLIYEDAKTDEGLLAYSQVPFTAHQERIALRN